MGADVNKHVECIAHSEPAAQTGARALVAAGLHLAWKMLYLEPKKLEKKKISA